VDTAFFEPAGPNEFVATAATAGPWSAQSQHGGPPSALAARAFEPHERDPAQRLARVAVDILRPIPLGKITIRTRTVRPGKRVTLLEAVLEAGGQEVMQARGWRIAVADRRDVATPLGPPPPPIPAEQPLPDYPGAHMTGYMQAIDWRYASGGGFDRPGAAKVWTRPRIPLVPGEEISPMSRTLLIADSGNGVSATLDLAEFLFVNVDLTVVAPRDPDGEWLLLDAATTIGEQGTGLAESVVHDQHGPCARAMQTLIVSPH
jgi:Thioesterase-like superfamily